MAGLIAGQMQQPNPGTQMPNPGMPSAPQPGAVPGQPAQQMPSQMALAAQRKPIGRGATGAKPAKAMDPKMFQKGVAKLVQLFTYALHRSGMYEKVGQLLHGQNPAQSLADLTYGVLNAVVEKVPAVPVQLYPAVSMQCLTIMLELGHVAGVLQADPNLIVQAAHVMMQKFMQEHEIDPAKFDAAGRKSQIIQKKVGAKSAPEGSSEEEAAESPEEESAENEGAQ